MEAEQLAGGPRSYKDNTSQGAARLQTSTASGRSMLPGNGVMNSFVAQDILSPPSPAVQLV